MSVHGTPKPAQNERPTLKTVSEATGLSMSTVSLAMRGGSAVREETRRKVLETAERLGYVPDRAGVRLRTGKTNVIALVLDGTAHSIEFTRHLIEGIGQTIDGTRYHLNVTPDFNRTGSVETVQYLLQNRLADGIILTHTAPRDPRVQLLADAGLPFVTHGRTEFYSPHPYHDFDSQAFVEMAVERLAARGCRDVMLFSANDHTTNHHTIVQSFTQAATRHNIRTRVAEKFDVDSSSQAQRRFGAKLAQMVDRPDGIICDNEILALALFSGLREGGIRPGLDIPVVVKQNSDILPTVFPDIDLIGEDVIEAGNELARLLLERINDVPAESLQTLGAPHPQWDA